MQVPESVNRPQFAVEGTPSEQYGGSRRREYAQFDDSDQKVSNVHAASRRAQHQRLSQDLLLTSGFPRLEAATSRLEDIATSVDGSTPLPNGAPATAAAAGAGAAAGVAAAGAVSLPPAPAEPLPRSIEDFDKLIEEDVNAFFTASKKIGGLVEDQAGLGKQGRQHGTDMSFRRKQSSKHLKLRGRTS